MMYMTAKTTSLSPFAITRRGLAAALVVCVFALSGCTGAETLMFVGSNSVSKMKTGKTLPDRFMSSVFDLDCSVGNLAKTGDYCQDYPPVQVTAPVYCYQTIGGVDCYDSPDTLDPRQQPVGGMAQQIEQKKKYNSYLQKTDRPAGANPDFQPYGYDNDSPAFLDDEAEQSKLPFGSAT